MEKDLKLLERFSIDEAIKANVSKNLISYITFFIFPVLSWYSSTLIFLENDIYFSSLFGIQLILSDLLCWYPYLNNEETNKWESYPFRLWI